VQKRSILTPSDYQQSFPDFWREELGNAALNGNILPHMGVVVPDGRSGGISSSASRIFGNQDFRFGAKDQSGCVTIWVLAKQGLWVSHIWEIPGMTKFQRDQNGKIVEQDMAIFQPTVLDFIRDGNPGRQNSISFSKARLTLFSFQLSWSRKLHQ
jgi:hypothetical protein